MNLYKMSIAADIGDDQVTIFQGEVPVRYYAYLSKLTTRAICSITMFRHKKMVGKITHQVDQGRKTIKLFHYPSHVSRCHPET